MMKNNKEFFIGIDLGWKEKKTTGLCLLEERKPVFLEDVFGKDVLKTIRPYLKETKVIAIDAPLTQGKGKKKMRLYEKFLSSSIFKKEKINPLPPALIFKLSDFARELVKKLKKEGFVLGINLIEVFPTNQESALLCAQIALLHSQFKTRWLGYKDGFLFLPEMSFWKKEWREKFYYAWKDRPRLKYHYLITNIFK